MWGLITIGLDYGSNGEGEKQESEGIVAYSISLMNRE